MLITSELQGFTDKEVPFFKFYYDSVIFQSYFYTVI